ncbi:MAG TPA: VOC family protein [Microlunatus sp.]
MTHTRFDSVLIGSADPARLRDWYRTTLGIEPDRNGVLDIGGVGLLIDGRGDMPATTCEPGRIILNLATDDAKSLTARLDSRGVRWIAKLEEREHGLFATFADADADADADGNYVQVLQMNVAYRTSSGPAYSGFAVDDVEAARTFYGETLGMPVTEEHGLLSVTIAPGTRVLIYHKADHVPAGFTVLNIPVDDIDTAVDLLSRRGVRILRFDGVDVDERGISRGPGPDIAWFTDPAGNILSVLREKT